MLEEIIVTAERRQSSLQETALAVSAFTGDTLEKHQVTDFGDLAPLLPNVNFGHVYGNARISVRGIGFDNFSTGSEARVAFHSDGVYVSRPSGALTKFFDIERIEVVRGPQGTLYGRNATGGAVNVITRNPTDELGGYFTTTLGNYSTINVEGAVNIPISDRVAARVAIISDNRDGYGENIVDGGDIDDMSLWSVRGKLKFDISDTTTWVLSGDYVKQDDHNGMFHFEGPGSVPVAPATEPSYVPIGYRFDGEYPSDIRDVAANIGPDYERENYSFTSDLNMSLSWADLDFITGYRHTEYDLKSDLDASTADLSRYQQYERSHTFSQEIRLSSDEDWGDWVAGVYYFDEGLTGYVAVPADIRVVAPPAPATMKQGYQAGGDLDTNSWAGFGQARWAATDSFAVVVGARWSSEKKTVDEYFQVDFARNWDADNPVMPAKTQQADKTWTNFSPRVTLEYQPNDDMFIYGSYAQGFKSGGFNLGGIQAPFDPEKVTDYELGMKADWLSGTLRTNVTAFYYDYKDLQVSKVVGASITIENAAKAKIKGLEFEIVALPTDGLQLELNVGLLDAKYDEYETYDPANPTAGLLDLKDNKLLQAPDYTITTAAEYGWEGWSGLWTARVESTWVDDVWGTAFNTPTARQSSYNLTNLFLTYNTMSDNWTLTAYVRNLGDSTVRASYGVSSALFAGAPVLSTLNPPRTYGIQAMYRF